MENIGKQGGSGIQRIKIGSSYNASTGILTISSTSNSGHFDKGDGNGGIMWTEDWSCSIQFDVYAFIPNV